MFERYPEEVATHAEQLYGTVLDHVGELEPTAEELAGVDKIVGAAAMTLARIPDRRTETQAVTTSLVESFLPEVVKARQAAHIAFNQFISTSNEYQLPDHMPWLEVAALPCFATDEQPRNYLEINTSSNLQIHLREASPLPIQAMEVMLNIPVAVDPAPLTLETLSEYIPEPEGYAQKLKDAWTTLEAPDPLVLRSVGVVPLPLHMPKGGLPYTVDLLPRLVPSLPNTTNQPTHDVCLFLPSSEKIGGWNKLDFRYDNSQLVFPGGDERDQGGVLVVDPGDNPLDPSEVAIFVLPRPTGGSSVPVQITQKGASELPQPEFTDGPVIIACQLFPLPAIATHD